MGKGRVRETEDLKGRGKARLWGKGVDGEEREKLRRGDGRRRVEMEHVGKK